MNIHFHPRLQVKLILAFVIVLFIPTAAIGTYTINTSSTTLIEEAQASALQNAQRDSDLIGTVLSRSSSDVLTISQSAALLDYVNALALNDAVAIQNTLPNLKNLLTIYLRNNQIYDNITLLEPNGQEIVRLNDVGGNMIFMEPKTLQSRANENYFKAALSLAPNQVNISRLALSTTHGTIEKPYKPLLHLSVAVLANTGKVGTIVVMDLLGEAFTSLLKSYDIQEQVYLIDVDGTYLAGPDPTHLYGRDLGTGYSLYKDSPDEAGKIFSQLNGTYFGSVDHPDLLQAFARISPNMGSQNSSQSIIRWTVYRIQPIAVILTNVNRARIVVLGLSVFAFLIAILLASFVTFQIVRPIRQLAKAATLIGTGQWDTPLPKIQSRDEIGDLTSTFNEMTNALKRTYKDLQQRTQDLELANILAKESSRLKSEFMATMSHELRTPLNAMLGFSGLMIEGMGGELDSEALHMVRRIDANSHRLLGLINDVLDIAKIEAGRLEIVSELLNLQEVVNAWRSQMSILAEKKGLTFNVELSPDLPTQIYGDKEHMTQIVVNLLSNAFKFTDAGSVALTLKCDNDTLILEVCDTGIGIPAHAVNYIFDEFRQVDGSTQRAFGGTGLGLAIVRNLCRMMNGSVHVTSVVGAGSVFTVALPLNAAAQLVLV